MLAAKALAVQYLVPDIGSLTQNPTGLPGSPSTPMTVRVWQV